MAKKPQQELGGLPPELQTDANQVTTESLSQPEKEAITYQADVIRVVGKGDALISGENVTEFIVATGHTVRHNGIDYPENTVIEVFGDDASRLFRLGVIIRLDDLRARLLSNNPVTVQSGVKI